MTVYSDILNDVYKNKMDLPVRPKKPVLPVNATVAQAREFADALEAYENGKVEETYKALCSAYSAETNRLEEKLRHDLETENEIPHGSKVAGVIWSKAWSYGHPAGYSDVAFHYDEFAEVYHASK